MNNSQALCNGLGAFNRPLIMQFTLRGASHDSTTLPRNIASVNATPCPTRLLCRVFSPKVFKHWCGSAMEYSTATHNRGSVPDRTLILIYLIFIVVTSLYHTMRPASYEALNTFALIITNTALIEGTEATQDL